MPSFKEEHILIVAPGSKTTLAQLGLPESFGPAAIRVPTRVFIDEKDGKYRPNKIRAKRVKVKRPIAATSDGAQAASNLVDTPNAAAGADQEMSGTGGPAPVSEAALPVPGEIEEEITQYEEDVEDEEGAIHPIVQGRVVDHEALKAVLSHIDNLVSPPMHTPVLVVTDPGWNQGDKEAVAAYYFETLQRPAVSFVTSPLAACGGFGTLDACVIDVGFEKTSVSSVLAFNLIDDSVNFLNGVGGQTVNESLMKARHRALASGKIKGVEFTQSMVEQLKKQPYICEVLQPDVPLPTETAPQPAPVTTNPAAAASTGVEAEQSAAASASAGLPRGPGAGTQTGGDGEENDNEGVLDVASIVASGKASEILAKREQDKADRAPKVSTKKGAAGEPPKAARLTNAQKARVPFRYTERVKASELQAATAGDKGSGTTNGASAASNAAAGGGANGNTSVSVKTETSSNGVGNDEDEAYVYANREMEIGIERFAGCDADGFLVPLTMAVVDSIGGAPADKRQDLWNNIIIVGNGSRVKGLKERIISHLAQQCIISPNNNTMFTSELPSQFSTPVATGANTPQPGFHHHGSTTPVPGAGGSAVNPLLLAATTASQLQNQGGQLAPPGQPYQASMQPSTPGQNSAHSHQHPAAAGAGMPGVPLTLPHMPVHVPTSIKLVPPKDYFPEWKDHGFEEAVFLGACVMARVNFMQDQGQPASFMTRVQWNEEGPTALPHYTLG